MFAVNICLLSQGIGFLGRFPSPCFVLNRPPFLSFDPYIRLNLPPVVLLLLVRLGNNRT